jgi:hypothetical protein
MRTLPMVLGLLVTSLGSGIIVGRTGRYKIFPIAGTAIMAIGFLLLSQMNQETSTLVQSLDLLVLGAGIGLSMQVLILVVQNTVDFTDLGVATSGVTFFRTIGSSFGAAIFGSLFANFLKDRLAAAMASSGAPAEAATSPQALHRLPEEIAAPIVTAYADSLSHVFLYAAPVAVVGFILALFLKQVPLRDAAASGSTDLGEGFGMPTTEPPEKLLEVAIGRLLQRTGGIDLESVSHSSRTRLDTARLWALIQVYRYAAAAGTADLSAVAAERRVPRQILEPTFDRLVATGYATRVGNLFSLTPAGAREVSIARDVISSWITETLSQSRDFNGRPDRMQVQGALDRVARGVLLEQGSSDGETRPMKLGAPRAPVEEPHTTRLRAAAAAAQADPPTRPFRPRATMPPRPVSPPPRRP